MRITSAPLQLIVIAASLWGGTAAAETCYKQEVVPSAMSCAGSKSNSADFATGCSFNPATVKQVVVDCPVKPGGWYQVSNGTSKVPPSHDQFCASIGKKAGNINGQICASGERRPSTGTGHASISYTYGKWGKTNTEGGSIVTNRQFGGYNYDNNTDDKPLWYSYCWHSTQKKDHDGTDMLVAYHCQ